MFLRHGNNNILLGDQQGHEVLQATRHAVEANYGQDEQTLNSASSQLIQKLEGVHLKANLAGENKEIYADQNKLDEYLSHWIDIRDIAHSHERMDAWSVTFTRAADEVVVSIQKMLDPLHVVNEYGLKMNEMVLEIAELNAKIIDLQSFLRGKSGTELASKAFTTYSQKLDVVKGLLSIVKNHFTEMKAGKLFFDAKTTVFKALRKEAEQRAATLRDLQSVATPTLRREEIAAICVRQHNLHIDILRKIEESLTSVSTSLEAADKILSRVESQLVQPSLNFQKCAAVRKEFLARMEAKKQLGFYASSLFSANGPVPSNNTPAHSQDIESPCSNLRV